MHGWDAIGNLNLDMIPLSTVQVAACDLFFSGFVDNDCGTLFPKMPCEEIESLDGSGLSVPMFLQANCVCQGSFACSDPNNSVCF